MPHEGLSASGHRASTPVAVAFEPPASVAWQVFVPNESPYVKIVVTILLLFAAFTLQVRAPRVL